MKQSWYARIVLLTALAVLLPSVVLAQEDITPPVLQSLAVGASVIDVTTGPQAVAFTAHITDDLSGLVAGCITFQSPSGTQSAYTWFYPPGAAARDGVYQSEVHFPQYAEAGLYHLIGLWIIDAVGNGRNYTEQDLAALGFPTTVQVISGPDVGPPVVRALDLSSRTVEVSDGAQTVSFTTHITDDLAGFVAGCLSFQSPGGTQSVYTWFYPADGPSLDGVYQAQLRFPQYAEAGVYHVTGLWIIDAVGNGRNYTEQDLIGLGLPTTIEVVSVPADVSAPALTGLAFDAQTVNVSAGPQLVNFTAGITDDLSGFSAGCLSFQSPSGQQSVYTWFYPAAPAREGVYAAQLRFPQYAEAGEYHLISLWILDAVGNGHNYIEQELATLGIQTTISVVYNEPPVVEAGADRTVLVGEAVAFDGSESHDSDGTIVGYQWDFGDGATGTGTVATHTYGAVGQFVVTLTVTDDQGATGTDTATVTVQTSAQGVGSLQALLAADNLKPGVASSLNDKLKNALASLQAANAKLRQDAPNKLAAFINAVEAQRGKGMTSAQADELEALARRILAGL